MKDIVHYEMRLNEMIVKDIKESAFGLDKLVKSEMMSILKNYFIVSSDDVNIEINATSSGKYNLTMNAKISGVKKLKKII